MLMNRSIALLLGGRRLSLITTNQHRLLASGSSNKKNNNNDNGLRVTLTDDGSTIVCWHPKQTFPYEHSLPYVEEPEELHSQALKPDILQKATSMYTGGMSVEELQAITYTNKDVWRRRRDADFQLRPKHPRSGV